MIVKILSTALLGIAALFGLEAVGVVPAGKYFPSMPRLDPETNTAANWLSAGNWGLNTVSCMTQGESLAVCTGDARTASLTERAERRNPSPAASRKEALRKEDIVWDEVDTVLDENSENGDSAANESSPSFTQRVASKS